MRFAFLLIAATSLAGASLAQIAWSGPVTGSLLQVTAYDSHRDRYVGIGYSAAGGVTIEFDGVSTQQVLGPSGTPQLGFNQMVYDPERRRIVAFAGLNAIGNPVPDTWEYDGVAWTQVDTLAPFSRPFGSAFHSGRGTVIAFGNESGYGLSNELWEWNGVSWSNIQASIRPPVMGGSSGLNPGAYSAFLYDTRRDRLVAYGLAGSQPHPATPPIWFNAVTWEWDAVQGWQQVAAGGPQTYSSSVATFDEARGVAVMTWRVAGTLAAWERSGGSWQQRTVMPLPTPTSFSGWSLCFDNRRNRVACFYSDNTGSNNLRYYTPGNPSPYETIGWGCPGPQGISELRLSHHWTRAWLGDSLSVDVSPLPNGVAMLATGLSDTMTWTNQPLPMSLAQFGMPNCTLYVDPLVTQLGAGTSTATFTLPVPNVTAALGVPFFQQALVYDTSANSYGAVLTNSNRGVVGSR